MLQLLSKIVKHQWKAKDNGRLTSQNNEITDKVGIGIMQRASAKFVAILLAADHKQLHLKSHKTCYNVQTDIKFLDIMITGDELWILWA